MTLRPPADLLANAKAPLYIYFLIYTSRFLLEKVGLKCPSGPKDSPRGLVKRRDKAPSQCYQIFLQTITRNKKNVHDLNRTNRLHRLLLLAEGAMMVCFGKPRPKHERRSSHVASRRTGIVRNSHVLGRIQPEITFGVQII
ncbi:hypothetical protein TNCV_2544021 [Trichonephila clavipes]|nr:hypothetical protein TNCV_2544021 [Trichonephila clavipes]